MQTQYGKVSSDNPEVVHRVGVKCNSVLQTRLKSRCPSSVASGELPEVQPTQVTTSMPSCTVVDVAVAS